MGLRGWYVPRLCTSLADSQGAKDIGHAEAEMLWLPPPLGILWAPASPSARGQWSPPGSGAANKRGQNPQHPGPIILTFVLPATNMRINQGVTAMVLRRPSSSAHSRYRTSDLVSKVTLTAAGLRPSPGLQVPTLTGTQ